MTPRNRLKNVDIAVLFLQKVLQANKITAKSKKKIRPTNPNFEKHVIGNTHIFLFGLTNLFQIRLKTLSYFCLIFLLFKIMMLFL